MKTGKALIDEVDSREVPAGQCSLWWLGQQGFIAKLGRTVCYFDPYLTPDASRQVAPLLKAGEITNASLVFGSHDHGDHIDREAWPGIAAASPRAKFIVPQLLREKIVREVRLPDDRVLGADEGTEIIERGIRVTAIAAAHEFLDEDPATALHPYLGYLVEGNEFRLYHAGDTCVYEGMQAKLRAPALGPGDSADQRPRRPAAGGTLHRQHDFSRGGGPGLRAIWPGMTIPAHFGMFTFNSENPQSFADYLHVKYPHLDTCIPRHGERIAVRKKG